jgi:hypothetical protein
VECTGGITLDARHSGSHSWVTWKVLNRELVHSLVGHTGRSTRQRQVGSLVGPSRRCSFEELFSPWWVVGPLVQVGSLSAGVTGGVTPASKAEWSHSVESWWSHLGQELVVTRRSTGRSH